METKVITSKQYSISWRDVLRSAILSAIVSALTLIQQNLYKQDFIFNWKYIAMAAISTFIGKLLFAFLQADRVLTVPGKDADLKDTAEQIKTVV